MKKFTLCLIVILFCLSLPVLAQNDLDYKKLVREGIEAIDKGENDKAIEIFNKCRKIKPSEADLIDYEIAFAYYNKKDYSKAISILKRLNKKNTSSFQTYQLLGNAYDMNKQSDKAIETYEKGMKKFPNRGNLYLEKGVVLMAQEKYSEAINTFEKGISVDPNYPSNYYHLARLFYGTEEEVWGLLYGELFMNLERNSKRTETISELMFKLYKKSVKMESDTSGVISMTQRSIVLDINDIKNLDKKKTIMPFENSYEISFAGLVIMGEDPTVNGVIDARKAFLQMWDKKNRKEFSNALIEYQYKIKDAGHFEAYSHWVLLKADQETFATWVAKNETQWKEFVSWYTDHPLQLEKEDTYYRRQY